MASAMRFGGVSRAIAGGYPTPATRIYVLGPQLAVFARQFLAIRGRAPVLCQNRSLQITRAQRAWGVRHSTPESTIP